MSQLSRAEKLTLCSDNSIRLYVCLQSWAKIESQKIRIIISLTFFCWPSLSFHRPFLVPHVMHIYNSWGSVGARSMISCPCAIIKEFIINFTYIFSTESPSSLSSILLINHSINSRYSSLHWRVSSKPKIEFHVTGGVGWKTETLIFIWVSICLSSVLPSMFLPASLTFI